MEDLAALPHQEFPGVPQPRGYFESRAGKKVTEWVKALRCLKFPMHRYTQTLQIVTLTLTLTLPTEDLASMKLCHQLYVT